MGILDEACLIAAGITINVVAYREKNKTKSISDYFCDSITTLRVGFSSRDQDASLFLAKGHNIDRINFKDIPNNSKAPPESKFIMTPNSFMTNKSWIIIMPKLCKSVSSIRFIIEHPGWWLLFSLDGYGSNVNFTKSLEIFSM